MKPVSFHQHNVVFAQNQPQYLPLPAWERDGEVITCWSMTWHERLLALWTGKVWLRTLTFNGALQPQRVSIESPFEKTKYPWPVPRREA